MALEREANQDPVVWYYHRAGFNWFAFMVLSLGIDAEPENQFTKCQGDFRMLHAVPFWLLASLAVMGLWGAVGITQKLATNHVSAESTTILLTVGYICILPFVASGFHVSVYQPTVVLLALGAGVANLLGCLTLFAAMRNGGKASIIMPLTALYPVVVVVLSPSLFGDHISGRQIWGLGFGLVSIALLSR
jgi:transporter family protein